jgi:hypothetical protein
MVKAYEEEKSEAELTRRTYKVGDGLLAWFNKHGTPLRQPPIA